MEPDDDGGGREQLERDEHRGSVTHVQVGQSIGELECTQLGRIDDGQQGHEHRQLRSDVGADAQADPAFRIVDTDHPGRHLLADIENVTDFLNTVVADL